MEKPSLDQLRIERKPEKEASGFGKAVSLILVLALLAACAAYWFWIRPGSAIEVLTVAARELQREAAATVLNASGYVTARRQATVSSKFTGKVTEVLIEEGMLVESGQVLARLDDSNIRAQVVANLAPVSVYLDHLRIRGNSAAISGAKVETAPQGQYHVGFRHRVCPQQ